MPFDAAQNSTVWRGEGCTIAAQWLSPRIIAIRWQGDVTRDLVDTYLAPLHAMVSSALGRTSLLYDLLSLERFQVGILPRHARFAIDHLGQLDRVAIATDQAAHRLAVATIGSMQPLPVKAFKSPAEAKFWLEVRG